MPTVDDNLRQWDAYAWSDGGEEWSRPWGNASLQWAITIYPRIMHLLPVRHIIEIAPGNGRWLPFLLAHCQSYFGVDISPRCIEYCQRTYSRLPQKPRFKVGDGLSLPFALDCETDFVFSFDSLVHVEIDCLSDYAKEIYRVLRPGGHGFLHHSNIGEYEPDTVTNDGWRGVTVSADNFGRECTAAGLQVLSQEKIPWVFRGALTDCFTLVKKPRKGETPGPCKQFVTADFFQECEIAARLARQLPEDDGWT
jgi:SAM-dependent methyltransferase